MNQTMIWVLSISVLGPTPSNEEIPKFNSREDCLAALKVKREEYSKKRLQIVGNCSQSTKSSPKPNNAPPAH